MNGNVKVTNGYAPYSKRADAPKCGVCPMRDRYGLCPIRAEVVPRNRPICRYGHKKILKQRKENRNGHKDPHQEA